MLSNTHHNTAGGTLALFPGLLLGVFLHAIQTQSNLVLKVRDYYNDKSTWSMTFALY